MMLLAPIVTRPPLTVRCLTMPAGLAEASTAPAGASPQVSCTSQRHESLTVATAHVARPRGAKAPRRCACAPAAPVRRGRDRRRRSPGRRQRRIMTTKAIVTTVGVAGLALVPVIAHAMNAPFYLTLVGRI